MVTMRIFGTTVKVNPIILIYIVPIWAFVTWLGIYWHPGRGIWQALLIGLATVLLLLFAEYGHPIAHTFSARRAGAPMDEILISLNMPRTLYWDNAVSPKAHRLRAMGGPLFNILGLLLSLAIYGLIPGNAIVRELAVWSAAGHGLLLIMSLIPLPIVDGGALLKWTLVARGKTETEADEIVKSVDWGIGILAGIIGAVLFLLRTWVAGGVMVGIGVVVMGITAYKIR